MSLEVIQKKEVGQHSPIAGCAILTAALLVMVFLIGFSVTVMFRQSAAISKFTVTKATAMGVTGPEGRERELNALAEKLENFRQAVSDGESAELELGVEELNLAIGSYEALKDLRGMLEVRTIDPKEMRLGISFQLNGRPRLGKGGEEGWVTSDPRYLNGVMIARPELLQREVILQISGIEVPRASVAQEFIGQMSPYRIAKKYVDDEGIGSVMAGLTSVGLDEGVIRFVKEKGRFPDDAVTDKQVDIAGRRLFMFLGIAASAFLGFAAIVIFLGLRLKKSRKPPLS